MDRKYWFWLNHIEGIGNIKIRRLLAAFHDDASEIFFAEISQLKAVPGISEKDIMRILDEDNKKRRLEEYMAGPKEQVKYIFPIDPEYPQKLKEIYDRPHILYYKGRLPIQERLSVAVVGSRNCSEYGESVATELGRLLGQAGVNVISGLAMGIDSFAHRGAVLSGGRTFGVLAGGVDKCYPGRNFNLYEDMLRNGGVISEFPPGTPTSPGLFPLRNRIISGLSDAVIIVEAGAKSGSLITAAQALEQNRQIYAVPGRIGDADSEGCNRLLRDGAQIVTSYEQLFCDLGLSFFNKKQEEKNNLVLAREEKMLYSLLLKFKPKSLDTLLDESGMEPGQALSALLGLELKGLIKEKGKNFYIRII